MTLRRCTRKRFTTRAPADAEEYQALANGGEATNRRDAKYSQKAITIRKNISQPFTVNAVAANEHHKVFWCNSYASVNRSLVTRAESATWRGGKY